MRGSHFSFDTFTLFCLSVHSDTFHQLIIFLLFPAQRPVPGIFQHHGGHHQQQHRRNESPRTAHHQIHGHNSETALPHDTNRHIEHIPLEGRNLFFLSIAAVYARELGINHIVTGVSQTDFSGYPDCRDAFIKSLNVTLNLAMDEQFVLHTPLMWIDKAETWALADELGVLDLIRHETLTCYNGVQGDGCGHCPACKLRREGLEKYLEIKAEREKR